MLTNDQAQKIKNAAQRWADAECDLAWRASGDDEHDAAARERTEAQRAFRAAITEMTKL